MPANAAGPRCWDRPTRAPIFDQSLTCCRRSGMLPTAANACPTGISQLFSTHKDIFISTGYSPWDYSQRPENRTMDARPNLSFDDLNTALKAAGEETRLRILALLAEAELTVSDLTDILRQSQPRISRHLKLLAEAGLVDRFREGSWAFFRLAETGEAADVARTL